MKAPTEALWCVTHNCSAFSDQECHKWVMVPDCQIVPCWVVLENGPRITVNATGISLSVVKNGVAFGTHLPSDWGLVSGVYALIAEQRGTDG